MVKLPSHKAFLKIILPSLMAVAGLAFVISHTSFSGMKPYWNAAPFDPVAWRQVQAERSGVRRTMVRDLLKHHSPVGMTTAEVDKLLGRPSWTRRSADSDYVYELGDGDGFIVLESSYLGLTIKNGVVTRAYRFTD